MGFAAKKKKKEKKAMINGASKKMRNKSRGEKKKSHTHKYDAKHIRWGNRKKKARKSTSKCNKRDKRHDVK